VARQKSWHGTSTGLLWEFDFPEHGKQHVDVDADTSHVVSFGSPIRQVVCLCTSFAEAEHTIVTLPRVLVAPTLHFIAEPIVYIHKIPCGIQFDMDSAECVLQKPLHRMWIEAAAPDTPIDSPEYQSLTSGPLYYALIDEYRQNRDVMPSECFSEHIVIISDKLDDIDAISIPDDDHVVRAVVLNSLIVEGICNTGLNAGVSMGMGMGLDMGLDIDIEVL
jgi:hypothetical protein